MTAATQWHRMSSVWVVTLLLFAFAASQVFAQNKNYTPGQKIEYKSSGYPEVWEEATFVGTSPDGSQPFIKQKPTQYQPDGFQRAASWGDIRPVAAARPMPKPALPEPPAIPQQPAAPEQPPAPPVAEQIKGFTAGQKIEYKSSNYPEIWEEATFVGTTPDGTQPIIKQKPTQYQPDGFQRAASWGEVRPLAAAKPAQPPAVPGPPPAPPVEPGPGEEDAPAADNDFAGGLMTKAEVLAFLAPLGPDPFQNPRREQVKQELAEMIKARGLNFRSSDPDKNFWDKLGKVGATSDIVFPLRDNYGPPTKQASLMGTWNLGKIGAAVDFEMNDELWRQNEIGVANVGALRLNANGTYGWKSVGAPVINGRWRVATPAEMKSKGGDGIVLLDAKTGYDWIVTKNRTTPLAGNWIDISELGTRQINEYGSRR